MCAQPPVWDVIWTSLGVRSFKSCLEVGSSDRKVRWFILFFLPGWLQWTVTGWRACYNARKKRKHVQSSACKNPVDERCFVVSIFLCFTKKSDVQFMLIFPNINLGHRVDLSTTGGISYSRNRLYKCFWCAAAAAAAASAAATFMRFSCHFRICYYYGFCFCVCLFPSSVWNSLSLSIFLSPSLPHPACTAQPSLC